MVNVCRFAVDADDDLQPLPLLRAGLLCVDLSDVVLALCMVERTRQRSQDVWTVDAESGSHF